MIKSFRLMSASICVTALLGGCGVIPSLGIPGLRMPSNVSINGADLPALIKNAQDLQAEYAGQSDKLSTDLDNSAKFNIIDGTALAAASIYRGGRDVLAFFGLAGGANIATDATFNPSLQLNTYESGYNAIACMIEKAQALPAEASNARASLRDKNNLLANARASLQPATQPVREQKSGESGKPAQPEAAPSVPANDPKVQSALQAELQKAELLRDAAASVDVAGVFKMNLANLDHVVRVKLREARKVQQPTALRDQLIANAVEAEKQKDQAKNTESAIKALNGLQAAPSADLNTVASFLGSYADIAAFDSNLKKCIAGAGF